MKRTIIAVISMALILFAFSACRPTIVGIPVDPTPGTDNPGTVTPPSPSEPEVSFIDNGVNKKLSWDYFDGSTWGEGTSSIEVVDGGLKLATGQAIYIGRSVADVTPLALADGDVYTISYSVEKHLKNGANYHIGLAINDENNAFITGQWMIPVTGNTVNVEITKSNGTITIATGDTSISAAGAIAQVVGGTTNFDEETDGYVILSDLSITKDKIEEPVVEFTDEEGTTTELSWNYFDGSTWENGESAIEVVDNGLKFATGQAIYIGKDGSNGESLELNDGDVYTLSYKVDKSALKAEADYVIGLAINDENNVSKVNEWMISVTDDTVVATIMKTNGVITISAEGKTIYAEGAIAQIVGATSNFDEELDGYVVISDMSLKRESLTAGAEESGTIAADNFTADTSALYDPRRVNEDAAYNPENFVINTEKGVAEVYGGASYFTFPVADADYDITNNNYVVSIKGSIPSDISLTNITEAFGFSVSMQNHGMGGSAFFHVEDDSITLKDQAGTETGIAIKPGEAFEIEITFANNELPSVTAKVGESSATWTGTGAFQNDFYGVYLTIYGAYASQAKGDLFLTIDSISLSEEPNA